MITEDLDMIVPSWEDIKYFLVLANTGTLSAAGEQLGVHHSTVGRRVEALEGRLNTDFFDRRGNRMILTAEGRMALQYAESMAQAAISFHRNLQGSVQKLAGSVVVNVTEGIANFWLMPRMQAFEQRHPELKVDYVTHNKSWDELGRTVDMALRWSRPTEPSAICRKLGDIKFLLFTTADYEGKFGYPRTEAELAEHNILHYTGYEINPQLEHWCDLMRKTHPAMKLENSSATGAALNSKPMIALLPAYSRFVVPGLVEVPLDLNIMTEMWLCYHEDRRKMARVRAVADEIESLWRADVNTWFS